MGDQAILWRRLDRPGHESARLSFLEPEWHLMGTAVFLHEQQPCRLDYRLICDSHWQTISGRVSGWVGDQVIQVDVSADAARRWRLNGIECPAVSGCLDLDLNFSLSTNLLPIRRLNLTIGQATEVISVGEICQLLKAVPKRWKPLVVTALLTGVGGERRLASDGPT